MLADGPWFGKRVPPLAAGGGREDGFREGGQVEEPSGSGQKFWQGVCGVPEREGHLLVTGRGGSRGRPLCGVRGFEAWSG